MTKNYIVIPLEFWEISWLEIFSSRNRFSRQYVLKLFPFIYLCSDAYKKQANCMHCLTMHVPKHELKQIFFYGHYSSKLSDYEIILPECFIQKYVCFSSPPPRKKKNIRVLFHSSLNNSNVTSLCPFVFQLQKSLCCNTSPGPNQ